MNAPIFYPTQPAAHLLAELVAHPDHDMQAEDWLHMGEMPAPVDVDLVLEQEQAEQARPWVTTTLRSIAKWALICAALSLLAGVLTGCGGGSDDEPEQVPNWCNWMGPPANGCTTPDTRLIEPPRDSRVL
jgi:hypothetical protein